MSQPQKLLITGCARSGTTLLHSLCGYLEDVKIYKYAETLPIRFEAKIPTDSPKKYILIKRPQAAPDDERYFGFEEIFSANYRIINIIRDGRDVLVSRHPDNPEIYWVKPERWLNAVNESLKYKDRSELLTLRYEALVQKPEEVLEQLADWLNVSLKKNFADFYKNQAINSYLQAATMEPSGPIHTASIQNWRKPEHKQRIEAIFASHGVELRETLGLLGYNSLYK